MPPTISFTDNIIRTTGAMSVRAFLRRTDDDGSASCPPRSIGCLTNDDGRNHIPTETSLLAASITSTSSSSTSVTATSDVKNYVPKTYPSSQVLIGILAIIALVLVFLLGGVALICGCRGPGVKCWRFKKRKSNQQPQPQVIHVDLRQQSLIASSMPELKIELP